MGVSKEKYIVDVPDVIQGCEGVFAAATEAL